MIDPDPKPRKKSEGWKIRLVKRFILANPDALMSDVVRATRTSLSTVTRAKRELVESGQLAQQENVPAVDAPTEGPVSGFADEEQIRKDVEAAVAAGQKPLTRAERRLRLSAYADHPKVPTAQKIQALKELEATEEHEDEKLGPGVPLTREDRVHRASLIIEALQDIDGQDAVADALRRAGSALAPADLDDEDFAPAGPLTPSQQDLVDFITRTDDDPSTERPAAPVEPTPPPISTEERGGDEGGDE